MPDFVRDVLKDVFSQLIADAVRLTLPLLWSKLRKPR